MAIIAGIPTLVQDGLVFYMDLGNNGLFKDKPTTNMLGAGFDITGWGGSSNRQADTTVSLDTYKGGTVWRLQDTDGVDPDAYVDNIWFADPTIANLTAGDEYTFSLDVRVLQKANTTNSGANNAIWIWYAGSSEFIYFSDLPLNEWTRVHVTATVGSSYDYLRPRIDYDNSVIEIANLQVEAGNIASAYVDGVRSDTDSILDTSSSKQVVTPYSLTYRQSDTPIFDGSLDKIHAGVIPGIDSSATAFTASVWVKPTRASTCLILENGENHTANTFYLAQENATYFTFEVYGIAPVANGSNNSYDAVFANYAYQLDVWYNLTGVWSANNRVELYTNGVNTSGRLIGSVRATVRDGTTDFMVGCRPTNAAGTSHSYPFKGELPQVMLYNRALSPAEIDQNYQALRYRYGV